MPKDGIGNAQRVCDKTRSSRFRSKKVFQLIFLEYKTSAKNCRTACAKNERREETRHTSVSMSIPSELLSSSKKPTLFATVKSTYNFIPKTCDIHISERKFSKKNVKTEEHFFSLYYNRDRTRIPETSKTYRDKIFRTFRSLEIPIKQAP